MIVCTQCSGNGGLQNNIRMTPGGLPNGITFTQNKQVPETTCPSCLGNGYMTGPGT